MARRERSAKLDTPTARSKLAARHAPYWHPLAKGLALGYRKGSTGGVWLARRYDAGQGFKKASLGVADDRADADGATALSFDQATDAARAWFAGPKIESTRRGPYTVADALADYEADAVRRGVKDLTNLRSRVAVHILPTLGAIRLDDLTAKAIRDWHAKRAEQARLARSKKLAPPGVKFVAPREDDPEAQRRRRSSANRILTVLKAALNLAFREGHVGSDNAWRRVQPFENVDGVRNTFLTPEDATRLIGACDSDFRPLVLGALLTGCRYGELTRLRVADVNIDAATIHVREAKNGKPRHVALSAAGATFFARLTEAKTPADHVFSHADGRPWRASDQIRCIAAACDKAKIRYYGASATSFLTRLRLPFKHGRTSRNLRSSHQARRTRRRAAPDRKARRPTARRS